MKKSLRFRECARSVRIIFSNKMKTYIAQVEETSYGFVEVEAENEKEAGEKAIEAVQMGDAIWKNSQLEVGKIDLK